MQNDLYERGALLWAERQAALLACVAGGERLNEAVDWPHVIEEVRDAGLSELRACQSLLQQAMVHLLKLHAWPASASAARWRDEAGTFLDDAERRFTPSMRQRIELPKLYAKSLRRSRAAVDDAEVARELPEGCPFGFDDLLAGDVETLIAKLA